jgi:PBP1b-binding outer membrane lipoprotein LpoB
MKALQWAAAVFALSVLSCRGPNMVRLDPDQDDTLGGTGVDSADLRATADKMARSLAGLDRIFAHGTPYVVVEAPVNKTSQQIDSSLFVQKIVTALMQNAAGKIQFVDRDHFQLIQKERELKRSGAVSVPTDPSGKPNLAAAPLGTDYFLTGELQSISKSTGKARSDYTVATFKLIDAETTALVWQNDYDWKKMGRAGVVYR